MKDNFLRWLFIPFILCFAFFLSSCVVAPRPPRARYQPHPHVMVWVPPHWIGGVWVAGHWR